MQVIPALNVKTFEEAMTQIKIASELVKDNDGWIHVDVSDGKFTSATTPWATPDIFKRIIKNHKPLTGSSFAIHLMVANPEEALKVWVESGAKFFVISEKTIKDFKYIKNISKEYEAEIMLGVDLEEGLSDKAELFDSFQVLAVPAGFSGQKFDMRALDKIKLLRRTFPNAKIEVDGGMNPETAKLVKEAGADIIVAASYIFNNPDPKKAYENLVTAVTN